MGSLRIRLLSVVSCLFLVSCGGGGGGSASAPDAKPLPPSGVTITQGVLPHQVVLRWTPPTSKVSGYLVDLKIGAGAFTAQNGMSNLVPAAAIELDVTLADTSPDDVDYIVRMRAVNGSAISDDSNEATYHMPLNAPTFLKGTLDFTDLSMHLTWKRNSTAADGYSLQRVLCDSRGIELGPWTDLPNTNQTEVSYQDSGLTQNAFYRYRVRNKHGDTLSAPCETGQLIDGIVPPTITSCYYDLIGVRDILNWVSPQQDGTVLTVERAPADAQGRPTGDWVQLPALTSPQYLDTSIAESTTYVYRLTNVHSPWSSLPALSGPVTTQLFSPVSLSATPAQDGIHLAWTDRSVAATSVVLSRWAGFNFVGHPETVSLPPSANTYSDLSPSLGYYTYRVSAANGSATSPMIDGDTVQVTTPNPPDALDLASSNLNFQQDLRDAALAPDGSWALLSNTSPIWATTPQYTIASTVGAWPSAQLPSPLVSGDPRLEVDGLGHPHTLFQIQDPSDTSHSILVHEWFDGSSWQTETLAGNLPHSWIGIDWTLAPDGSPQALIKPDLNDSPASLVWVRKVAGQWQATALAGMTAFFVNDGGFRIDVDPSGVTRVLLANHSGTMYVCAQDAQGLWTPELLPSLPVPSINLNGTLMFTWRDQDNCVVVVSATNQAPSPNMGYLLVIEKVAGVWQTPSVMERLSYSVGFNLLFAQALSSDRSRIAFAGASELGLKAYEWKADGWHQTLVAAPDALMHVGAGIDSTGHLRILLEQSGSTFKEFHE